MFLYHRNKQAATLDTRHPKALGILEDLVRWADVVVENFRPGTIDKMGIGYERMKELNPTSSWCRSRGSVRPGRTPRGRSSTPSRKRLRG